MKGRGKFRKLLKETLKKQNRQAKVSNHYEPALWNFLLPRNYDEFIRLCDEEEVNYLLEDVLLTKQREVFFENLNPENLEKILLCSHDNIRFMTELSEKKLIDILLQASECDQLVQHLFETPNLNERIRLIRLILETDELQDDALLEFEIIRETFVKNLNQITCFQSDSESEKEIYFLICDNLSAYTIAKIFDSGINVDVTNKLLKELRQTKRENLLVEVFEGIRDVNPIIRNCDFSVLKLLKGKINYLEIKEETARELFEKVMALNHEYEITDIIAFQDLADFYALLKDEQKERFVSEALPKYCAEMDRWETIFALYYSIGEQEKEEFIALLIENAEKPDSLYRLNEFFKVAAMKILDEEKNGSATKRVFLKYLEGKK